MSTRFIIQGFYYQHKIWTVLVVLTRFRNVTLAVAQSASIWDTKWSPVVGPAWCEIQEQAQGYNRLLIMLSQISNKQI